MGWFRARSWFALALLGSFALPVRGTTLVPMDVATLSDHAGQVLRASIQSVRSYWVGKPPQIESEVVLEQVTYLKGEPSTAVAAIRLRVPGGTIGTVQMRVAGAPEFQPGERWLLFLLPEYRTFPVVGIGDGAFRIQTDPDGVERVHGASDEPVQGLDEAGFVRLTRRGSSVAESQCVGAQRVTLAAPIERDAASRALTYEEFVALLTPILEKSRHHPLDLPAGRRLPVVFQNVPLVSAGAAATIACQESKTAERIKSNLWTVPREAKPQERTPDSVPNP